MLAQLFIQNFKVLETVFLSSNRSTFSLFYVSLPNLYQRLLNTFSELSFLDPQRYYGRGTYALTNVKQIRGTEGYIDLAKPGRKGMCQNVKHFQDFLIEDYIERGLEVCECIPLYLRNWTKQVVLPKSELWSAIYITILLAFFLGH